MPEPRSRRILLLAALAVVLATFPVIGQMDWKVRSQSYYPQMRFFHSRAYDTSRQRTVLFGGTGPGVLGDTWEWDGVRWTRLQPKSSPSPRYWHVMAYDAARARVVLFGGQDSWSTYNDTWEWDGTNWTQVNPATSPPVRFASAMAYDAARQRIVLFGGGFIYYGNNRNDTWEWDGNNWTLRTPTTSPPACYGHSMAYDSTRKRTVLFGGSASAVVGTWEWDGNNWNKQNPSTSPPWRYIHTMTYDSARQRTVLFGGDAGSGQLGDTWEWDGNNWSQKNTLTNPAPCLGSAMTYDAARKRIVLFGGRGGPNAHQEYNTTWEWDGATWTNVLIPAGHPSQRYEYAMTFDAARQRIVLFGGGLGGQRLSDTWEWDGTTWTQRNPITSPPGRFAHSMAYDSSRRRVVLFGGDGTGLLNDTWEWDGADWRQLQPAVSPPARKDHAMVYDSATRRIVLFGGATGTWPIQNPLNDTWEWDGTSWTRRNPTTSPSARSSHAMAYDAVSQQIVLFGGNTGGYGYLRDTWAWNGSNWSQNQATTGPASRSSHAMVWDVARQRVVLFGGVFAVNDFPRVYWTYYNDTWEWTGRSWNNRSVATNPPAYTTYQPMAYDAIRGHAVQLYSIDYTTWIYTPHDLTASANVVSVAAGGNVRLNIDPGSTYAGKNYWVAGCIDGTGTRGIPLGTNATLLLYPDWYFAFTVNQPNTVIASSLGTLDASGRATATIHLPPLPSNLIGWRFYHAYVVFQSRIDYASTPVPLTLVP
jgi:hypothetical protein